jgi:hypothetical protein
MTNLPLPVRERVGVRAFAPTPPHPPKPDGLGPSLSLKGIGEKEEKKK